MDFNETTWVIVLNSNACRMFKYTKRPRQLEMIKELSHPENKLHDSDLTSDKPGRYKAGSAQGTYSQKTDPKEIKIDDFIREVANNLEHSRTTHAYQKLIIVAANHTNGLLMKQLNKHVKNLISKNLEKDLMNLSHQELLSIISDL